MHLVICKYFCNVSLLIYQEMATFRTAALQKALDESIPEVEMQIANEKYNELTSKYRDLLQKENILISRSTAVENLRVCSYRFRSLYAINIL